MYRIAFVLAIVYILSACSDNDPGIKDISFMFHVSDDYISSNAKGWVFFSDESGETVYLSELINGSTVEFKTILQTKLTATIFVYGELPTAPSGSINSFILRSYVNIRPDEYLLDHKESDLGFDPLDAKRIDLTVKLSYPLNNVSVFGQGLKYSSSSYSTNGDMHFDNILTESPSDLTCVVFQNSSTAPFYKKLGNTTAGIPLVVSVDEMLPMENKHEIFLAEADYSSYWLAGVDKNGDQWDMYGDSRYPDSNPEILPIYYTKTEFDQIITNVSFHTSTTVYVYDLIDTKPAGQFSKINADIVSFNGSKGTITAKVNGVYDLFNSDYFESIKEGNQTQRYYWSVTFPGNPGYAPPPTSEINFKVPSIPEELRKKYNQIDLMKPNFTKPTITDYTEIPEYTDCFKAEMSDKDFYKVSKARTMQIKFLNQF